MHDTGHDGGGVLVLGNAGLVVLPLGRFGDAALFADKLQGLFRTLYIGLKELAVGTPAVDRGGEGEPFLQATLGGAALDNGGRAVALGDGDGLLLQHGNLRTHLGGLDRGDDTGGTGAADDDVHVDLFGKIGNGLKDDRGCVDVLGGDIGENIGAVGFDHGLDRAGINGIASGLGKAVVQSLFHGLAGEGPARIFFPKLIRQSWVPSSR